MSVTLKSTDVQQNFGKVMEQALTEDDVIVERYGEPRVAIISYRRYQQLLQSQQADLDVYLVAPAGSLEAQKRGQALAEEMRHELRTSLQASLEEVMSSLRGRTWLS
jgi:prevent-host-death family protein